MNFFKYRLSVAFDEKSITRMNYRPFIAGMIAVFLFKAALILGIELPQLFP